MDLNFIDVFLAFIGTVIAIIQVGREYKEYKLKKKKESKIHEALKLLEDESIFNLIQKMNKPNNGEIFSAFLNALPDHIIQCRNIYVLLVKLEEEVPFSTGFERYIINFKNNIKMLEMGRDKLISIADKVSKNELPNEALINCFNSYIKIMYSIKEDINELRMKFDASYGKELINKGFININIQ